LRSIGRVPHLLLHVLYAHCQVKDRALPQWFLYIVQQSVVFVTLLPREDLHGIRVDSLVSEVDLGKAEVRGILEKGCIVDLTVEPGDRKYTIGVIGVLNDCLITAERTGEINDISSILSVGNFCNCVELLNGRKFKRLGSLIPATLLAFELVEARIRKVQVAKINNLPLYIGQVIGETHVHALGAITLCEEVRVDVDEAEGHIEDRSVGVEAVNVELA
jgi:hypothetical protein